MGCNACMVRSRRCSSAFATNQAPSCISVSVTRANSPAILYILDSDLFHLENPEVPDIHIIHLYHNLQLIPSMFGHGGLKVRHGHDLDHKTSPTSKVLSTLTLA